MFDSSTKNEEYIPLASSPDGEPSSPIPPHKRSESTISSYLLWGCVLVACLSAFNVVLLPFTLRAALPLTEKDLEKLPYPPQRLGLDRAAKVLIPPPVWHHAWPDKIARLSQKLKTSVYGAGTDVFISVEDTTIMQFPIPSHGTDACSIAWYPPPELSPRVKDLETKGDLTEIEVWSIVASNPTNNPPLSELDFDNLSWKNHPVKGELLGTLDLTAKPNSTTVDFACPRDSDILTVEFRCLRVACHVKFKQVHMFPKMGFELLRRHE